MPLISEKYPVDKNDLFITGLSMGGHGALYLFEQKPGLFRSAGSTSGVLDLSSSRNRYRIKNLLGLTGNAKSDSLLLMKYSVIGNIRKIAASGKEIIFSCGTEDPFYQVNNAFRKACDQSGVKAIYISAPGTHNYAFWHFSIKYHFDFFKSLVPDSSVLTKKIADADILSPTRKNARFIKNHGIKLQQVAVDVGDKRFIINVFTKKGKQKQKFIVVHDSEDAAFDTGLRAIKHGGTFIALENNENRSFYSYGSPKGSVHQDPNRMFNKDNPYWPVAQKIIELLKASPKELIFALHNNKPGGNFILDTIATWKNISILSDKDPDKRSLIWIPFSQPEPDQKLAKEISFYKKKGMNVVYEYVPQSERGDGSLSVYSSRHNIPYRNIEVEAGVRGDRKSELKSRRKQLKYLKAVRDFGIIL